jgi:lysozyme
MQSVGIVRSAYHFFHPATSPEQQANHFLSVAAPLSAGDVPPVLDLEETSQTHDEWPGIQPASRLDLVLRWLTAVESALAVKPIIYTRRGWISDFLPNADSLSVYLLWIADYSGHPVPAIPLPWTLWTFWQYAGMCCNFR